MASYPVGYGTARVSFTELKRRYSGGMEPEYARRLFAWIASKGGAVGIGSGSRPNPSNVSAASRAGQSFHQTQTFSDGSRYFCAVDLVHVNGGNRHRTIRWSEVPEEGSSEARKWGLHCNVQSPQEPWHMQPIEIDGFHGWANSGRRRPAPGYRIPGDPGKVRQPKAIGGELGHFSPEFSAYGLYPLDPNKAEVNRDTRPRPTDLVRYLQGVLTNQCRLGTVDIDGYFGEQTQGAVKEVQAWNRIDRHGRCDAATWKCIDAYATL